MTNYYNYLDEAMSLFDKAIEKEQKKRKVDTVGMTEEQLIEAVQSGKLQVTESKESEIL